MDNSNKKEKYIKYIVNDFIDNYIAFDIVKKSYGIFGLFTKKVKVCVFIEPISSRDFKWFAEDFKDSEYTYFNPERFPFDVRLSKVFNGYGVVDRDEQEGLWKILCNELHKRLSEK